MTTMDGLPHTSSEPYSIDVLDYAERLGYSALEVAGTAIAAGRDGWGAFVAGADRRQLVQALGVVIAKAHREGKA
jgi:hypothetical protein